LQAAIRRTDIFKKANVPSLSEVGGARVTLLRPLRINDYGVVFTEQGLRVARGAYLRSYSIEMHFLICGAVIAFYSKTGGKHGKHSSITETSNISTISYIAVQLFEFMHGRQFRHTPELTSRLQTRQFALLPAMMFLTLLSSPPKVNPQSGTLELTQEDSNRFKTLDNGTTKFKDAMKLSKKRGKWNDNKLEDGE
jgi:hypothetical protein